MFNRFALQLEENKALSDFISTQKFTWEDAASTVGQLFETIESSDIYKEYMESQEDNYETDRELWRKLYKTFFMNNDELDAILEDQSLYWNDDKEIVDTFVLKTIKRFKEQNGAKEELLPEWDSDEEKDYARKLFRSSTLPVRVAVTSTACSMASLATSSRQAVCSNTWSPRRRRPAPSIIRQSPCLRTSRNPRNPNVNALKNKNKK